MSDQLQQLLNPGSIAVAGASPQGRGGGFLTPLVDMAYPGKIYPVNPKYDDVNGFDCYPSVRDIPGDVDYVISSVPSGAALDLMKDCVAKGVKCVHYFTARFSETGRPEDAALEQEILQTAKAGGVRIIGPNCMGLYNPGAGISMNSGLLKESGAVGFASQSGGVLYQIVGAAAQRGVRFTKAISYGNALDLNECDYLEHFVQDPDTKVILMYIEGLKDGQRFIRALEKATVSKPVIIMKGGRSNAGDRAAASHTASLAGAYGIFKDLVEAAGGVIVTDFDELVDMAVAFNFLPPETSRDLGVQGGSGGSSVNGADLLDEAGLNLVPIPQDIREQLKAEGISAHDWFNNPIDGSISMGDSTPAARLLELMLEHDDFKTFVGYPPSGRGPGRPLKPEEADGDSGIDIEAIMETSLHRMTKKPVIMLGGEIPRMPGKEEIADAFAKVREQLIHEGVPTFPTMTRAANALGKLTDFYDYRRKLAEQ